MKGIFKRVIQSFSGALTIDDQMQRCLDFEHKTMIIAHGQKTYNESYERLELSLETGGEQLGFILAKDQAIELIEEKMLRAQRPWDKNEAKKIYQLFHAKTKRDLDLFIEQLLKFQPPSADNLTQATAETKAQEWVKLSFGHLGKSLAEAMSRPELFIRSLLLIEKEKKIIHLRVFNLEIMLVIDGQQLWLEVHDYKKSETERELKLRQNFVYLHKQVFDEVLKLIIPLNKAILS
jgi:hypothetical protein